MKDFTKAVRKATKRIDRISNQVTWYTIANSYTNNAISANANQDVWTYQTYNDASTYHDTNTFTFRCNHDVYLDGGTDSGVLYTNWKSLGSPKPRTKGDLMRHKIKGQLAPAFIGRARPDFSGAKENEIVALGLLRSMIGSDAFRRYLRDGFIMVEGKSGKRYQVRRSHHLIGVWDNRGRQLGSLCVYISDQKIPPTDEVVAKMLIIECDEPDIWRRARKMGLLHGLKGPDDAIPQRHVRQQARIVEQNIPGLIVRAA